MEFSTLLSYIVYGVIGWFLITRFAPVGGLQALSDEAFLQRMKEDQNYVLIDVREPVEFRQGHIPGALNIPLSELKKRHAELPQDQDILVYCLSGIRSKQAARILKKKGFSKLSHLQRGLSQWNGDIEKP